MKSAAYIRGFDGLRAIAVSLVLAAHSGVWEALHGVPWFDRFLYPLVLGENGVLIFFVLSGFLITRLLQREQQVSGNINYRYFLLRRVLRLLPAFSIFWLLLLTLTLGGWYDIPAPSFVFSALYLYNFIPRHFYSGFFGLTWSLGVEEQFYLLWPLLLKVVPRWSQGKWLTWSVIVFVAISLVFMAVVPDLNLPGYSLSVDSENINLSDYTVKEVFFPYRWFIPMGSYLLLGCLAATWVEAILKKTLPLSWLLLLALLLLIAPWYATGINYFPQKLLQATGMALVMILIFMRQQHWIVRLLEIGPLRHLGKISYGLYLYSGIFLATGISHPEYWWQHQPTAIILTYIVALFSYHTIERYFLKKKARYRAAPEV